MKLLHNATFELWPDGVLGASGTTSEDIPALQVILPAEGKATGASMIVCPGGGYHRRAPHEGVPVGEWLAANGITAFILRYRVGPKYQHPIQFEDAQRALRFVRASSPGWGLDPDRLGILGFSAGGHLSSMTATHFTSGDALSADPIERASSRPDLQILIYPVISLETTYSPIQSLLGGISDPPAELLARLSTEKYVTAQTPPAFLVHSTGDALVPVSNSDHYALSLAEHNVPYEYVRGDLGAHGFGLLDSWTLPCERWLQQQGFANQPE